MKLGEIIARLLKICVDLNKGKYGQNRNLSKSKLAVVLRQLASDLGDK